MSNPVAQTIGFYGFVFTFPLAMIGHTCSLLTFSSKTIRNTSTGLLFIFLTISDILYQLMSIYDYIRQVLQLPVARDVYLCRFRTFILNFSTMTSAWLLVLISINRFIHVCFPYQQKRICTRKVICLAVLLVCIFATIFTCHVLQADFTFTFPTSNLCGPSRLTVTSYTDFYYNTWPILQLLITYRIPNCLMIICLMSIHSKLSLQRMLVISSMRKEKLQQQMFLSMISSIACFSLCTLPYSLHRIILLRSEINSTTVIHIAILTIFLNMNYSYNFYIYGLSSKLFREKFIERLKHVWLCWKRQHNNTVHPLRN